MAKKINPSRMTFRIDFGHDADTGEVNPNTGTPIQQFSPDFSCWAGQWSLNVQQQLTIAGVGITNEVVFFIRHNPDVNETLQIQRGTDLYKIDSIASDDGLPPDGFDLITCHRVVTKHG
ncbi:phage head-tail adapter protein [Levilactobacillus brevis]|uniref:phage head closure protein n=1 Tax=Levilactobacillus brevis TaxID=1580 RepID=UPI000A0FA29B|nr:phage head closure protein [Levilactobacillus brevis]ORJ54173.1 phage head-tail adapter protein [Levilactobacillus brevis]